MDIADIIKLCNQGKLRWTNHILTRLFQRGISTDSIVSAIKSGEIIEQYPEDYPYPSCLIMGLDVNKATIHLVCGTDDIERWLITAYYPTPDKWEPDFKTRKVKE